MADADPQMIDRFELIEPLGQGGMGSVYRARDTVIERDVALKIIDLAGFREEAEQDEARARVLREARAAGALSHPHIVAVHDAGEEGDSAWIVQELIDGSPFRPGAQPQAKTVELLRQAASALDYAHANGIVHRDVKPSNLLVDSNSQAKLADFGIAKVVAGDQMTRTGSLLGTPHYMSPEQLHEKNVGPRSDQFSLAVLAYEALVGKKPFDAESIPGLLAKTLNADPERPSAQDPSLSSAVDDALLRALSKDPADRFVSCREFVDALGAPAAVAAPRPHPELDSDGFSPKRLVALAAGAALLGAVAWFALGRETFPAVPNPPLPAETLAQEPISAPDDAPSPPPPESTTGSQPPGPVQPRPARVESTPAAPAPSPTPAPAPPPTPRPELRLGPAVPVVWNGSLERGAELLIENGQPNSGALSRTWPTIPMEVEVSPSAVLIVERPSPANNWSRLRLRSPDAPRTLLILRYRPRL